jgi:hypothetical protein
VPRCDQIVEPDSCIVATIGSSHIGIIHIVEIVGITAKTIVLYSCAGDFCGRDETDNTIRKHETRYEGFVVQRKCEAKVYLNPSIIDNGVFDYRRFVCLTRERA